MKVLLTIYGQLTVDRYSAGHKSQYCLLKHRVFVNKRLPPRRPDSLTVAVRKDLIDGTQAEYVRIPYADNSLYPLAAEAVWRFALKKILKAYDTSGHADKLSMNH